MSILAQKWPEVRQEAKPAARWWWPGSAVDEENLRWNMEQYASHGLGALEVTPIYGVQGEDDKEIPFLTQRWMDVVRFTEREGKRLGIQIDMTCGTGWRFGGPWVPEEETACKVVFRDTVVNESEVATIRLLPPEKEKEHAKLKLQRSYPTEERGKVRVIALYESRTMQP
ncbi:MAG: glycosyl hydrolase family 2, partial [Bacteroidaceae bacterium]|nr:glycosyl hydrolase family 2 [Bacteroidaceae bacterium]